LSGGFLIREVRWFCCERGGQAGTLFYELRRMRGRSTGSGGRADQIGEPDGVGHCSGLADLGDRTVDRRAARAKLHRSSPFRSRTALPAGSCMPVGSRWRAGPATEPSTGSGPIRNASRSCVVEPRAVRDHADQPERGAAARHALVALAARSAPLSDRRVCRVGVGAVRETVGQQLEAGSGICRSRRWLPASDQVDACSAPGEHAERGRPRVEHARTPQRKLHAVAGGLRTSRKLGLRIQVYRIDRTMVERFGAARW